MLTHRPLEGSLTEIAACAAANAPYLDGLLRRDGAVLNGLGTGDLPAAIAATISAVETVEPAGPEAAGIALRRAKRHVHLLTALADLSGALEGPGVTRVLTRFADAAVGAALRTAAAARSATTDGLFVIALGKMGAFELNYSSDIDLAVFYDPDRFEGGARGPGDTAARIVQLMLTLLQDQTAEGYVFRTDLRLRPDPRSTPVAVSTRMAALYYLHQGQNWERMVWIKARPCAGDVGTAAALVDELAPFVWRRHLDYWAIADIHAIKRMINADLPRAQLADTAPDVKLGPGGIREIEFFAQTQQLILGGRDPALRERGTLGALAALASEGVIAEADRACLADAYDTLRAIEHRIQMRHDAQDHTVPADPEERAAIARLCGIGDLATFDAGLAELRRAVHARYLDLFAEEARQADAARSGNLVFTGVDDDPATLATLARFGFADPAAVIDAVRDWHRGKVPATRNERGRQLLTALLPRLLAAMGETGEPDEAFRQFRRFFTGLSAGVQTLSMLLAEPDVLDDLVSTLAIAPRIAGHLARQPELLEALLSGAGPQSLIIEPGPTFDAALDAARRAHRDASFLIGHRLLHGLLPAREAADAWTDLADRTIAAMAGAALRETGQRFGPSPGRWSVIGMGKLGGRELTAGSDLDLLVIYDPDAPASGGGAGEGGSAQAWFTRFTQRLITALSAPTAEGELYEVDMRLRPSGRAGPVAVQLSAFERYQRAEAWTWEHMAMTRMRPVAGDPVLGRQAEALAHAVIAEAATRPGRIADIADMRARLRRERPASGPWDLKFADGGLVDIEFIIQAGLLLAGNRDLIAPATTEGLSRLHAAGALSDDEADTLAGALTFQQALQQVLRLAVGDGVDPADASAGLRSRLARAVGTGDPGDLDAALQRHQSAASAIFRARLAVPATDS